jgi:hypothetical protein
MLATLILLAAAWTAPSGGVVIDVAGARRATGEPVAAAAQARMQQLAGRGGSDALVDELRRVLADPALEPVGREWLLESGLHALRALPATPATRALASELATRAPRVFIRVEPEHGRQAVPLYDVGAAARYALRDWERAEARVAATRSLSLGSNDALMSWQREAARSAVRDGIADAFAAAGAGTLERQRPAIAAAIRSGRDVDAVALVLARRLRDAELFSLIIGYAEPASALAALQWALRDLDPGASVDVLSVAADRQPIASAALLAAGRLASAEPAARELLFRRLADPVSGESAAAALARLDDPGIAAQLAMRLQTTKDEPTRRRVALALKLNGGAKARDALAELIETRQGSPELRREVAAWLAGGR